MSRSTISHLAHGKPTASCTYWYPTPKPPHTISSLCINGWPSRRGQCVSWKWRWSSSRRRWRRARLCVRRWPRRRASWRSRWPPWALSSRRLADGTGKQGDIDIDTGGQSERVHHMGQCYTITVARTFQLSRRAWISKSHIAMTASILEV